MSLLHDVRAPLLDEARRSPNLLADLAGLEQYVAESYDARSFIELLQNADDAGASRFYVAREEDHLFVANDGRRFSRADFESLCRSAASSKARTSHVGYRGIGFKSIVSFAEKVHLISGDLEAMFCRTRTKQEVPQATRVPLVRIPHQQSGDDFSTLEHARQLIADGYHTVFVFSELVAHAIETEFGNFDPTSLLFLRHIRHVTLREHDTVVITLQRTAVDHDSSMIALSDTSGTSNWTLRKKGDVVLAFGMEDGKPVRLNNSQALFHAFLPTHEKTGLGIKINSDFSTDPSRTRIVLDERTAVCVKQTADFILDLVRDILANGSPASILEAVIPELDPRMAEFQRPSVQRELLTGLVECARGRFEKYRLRPSWFSTAEDFEKLAKLSGFACVSHHLETCGGIAPFLRSLGCRDATLEEMADSLKDTRLSVLGSADIVDHVCTLSNLGQCPSREDIRNWRIWPITDAMWTLDEVVARNHPLDARFLDLVREKSGSLAGLQRLLTRCGFAKNDLIPDSDTTPNQQTLCPSPTIEVQTVRLQIPQVAEVSLRKWRSGEKHAYDLLTARGWQVYDVSKQNLGYDLEASKPDEETIFVEVKTIDHPGQPFTLTSNEEAVAREKGTAYRIAVVRQTTNFVEIAFIIDPAHCLEMVRQCRQWVWYCDHYPFEPETFTLD